MSQQTVWAVVSGEYSDYKVHVLFPTEEQAKAHAKRRNRLEKQADGYGGSHGVEEFTMYDHEEPQPKIFWHADYYPRRPEPIEPRSTVVWPDEYHADGHVFGKPVPTRPDLRVNIQQGQITHIGAFGPDKKSVTKAVADRVAKLQAEQAGIA